LRPGYPRDPRGAKHKRQAFEFLAFVQRQDEMEKLCALHCKPSPLVRVSDEFNRIISTRISISSSGWIPVQMRHATVKIPIAAEVADEMKVMEERLALLERTPKQALAEAQERLTAKYADYLQRRHSPRRKRESLRRAGAMSSPHSETRALAKGLAFCSRGSSDFACSRSRRSHFPSTTACAITRCFSARVSGAGQLSRHDP